MSSYSRYVFWRSEEHWPREPEGSIFLARAMLTAAPIILGEDLAGDEFTVEWLADMPLSPAYATYEQIELANGLLLRLYPDRKPVAPAGQLGQSLANLGQGLLATPQISPDDWNTVRRLVADRQTAIFPALQKRARVTEWFARAAFDRGEIRMFACHVKGGEMLEAKPAIWNVKWPGFEHISRNCSTNWDAPMDEGAERTHFIFLQRGDFERALDAHRTSTGEESERLALIDNPAAANAAAPHSPTMVGDSLQQQPDTNDRATGPVRKHRETKSGNVDAALRASFGEGYRDTPRPDWRVILDRLNIWAKENKERKFPANDEERRREVYRCWPETS